MKSLRKLTILGIAVFASVFLATCTLQETERPPDEVTVQLKWTHQSQFAGFYVADMNGYYTEEGIAVTFIEGGPTIDTHTAVLNGTTQFGVTGADRIIVGRAQGNPLRAVAVIYRRSPSVYVAAADSGISRPEDFVGQNILAAINAHPVLHAMMSRVGVERDQYTVVTVPYDPDLFTSGETSVWAVYLTGSIRILQNAGYELNIIYPQDYGIHFYADTIFASDDFLGENPELVARFLRATLRGWQWAIENPEEAGALPVTYNPELDLEEQIAQMEASVPLIHTGQDHIGWMRAEVWEGMHDTLLEQGMIDGPIALDEIYTLQFLEEIYEN
ncbi:MAG: ABC transporter substrate-binding protein [Desulfobacteria bacterium]